MILPLIITFSRVNEATVEVLHQRGEIFQWTDRDSYLAWVAEWKDELRHRVEEIHFQKIIRRDKTRTELARNITNAERQRLRIACCNLFLLRRMGKELSYRQKQHRLAA